MYFSLKDFRGFTWKVILQIARQSLPNIWFSSVAQLCLTLCDPWNVAHQASLSITWSLLLVLAPGVCSNSCPSSWWCHPTISSSVVPFSSRLQSFQASGSFSSESALCTMWPKYWSFSFSISPSSEYSGLISLTIDWFDLLEVQGTLKSLLQHHSSKASVLMHSAFFLHQVKSVVFPVVVMYGCGVGL